MEPTQTEIPGALPSVPSPIAAISAAAAFTADGLEALVQMLRPLTLQMEQEAAARELTTDAEQQQATEQAALLRAAVKALEERRIALTKPLREEIARIDAAVAQVVGPAKQADVILSRKVIDRQRQREREAQAAREQEAAAARARDLAERRANEALVQAAKAPAGPATEPATLEEFYAQVDAAPAAAGLLPEAVLDLEPVAPVVAPPRRAVLSSGKTAAVKQNWIWELVDLARVPDEYLKPRQLDTAKLTRVVKAGVREIPGITIRDAGSLEVRS